LIKAKEAEEVEAINEKLSEEDDTSESITEVAFSGIVSLVS